MDIDRLKQLIEKKDDELKKFSNELAFISQMFNAGGDQIEKYLDLTGCLGLSVISNRISENLCDFLEPIKKELGIC